MDYGASSGQRDRGHGRMGFAIQNQLRVDEPRVVREQTSALMALATEHGLLGWSTTGTMLHGWAMAEGDSAEAAIAQMPQGLAARYVTGIQLHTPSFLGLLAGLYLKIKNSNEALKLLDEAMVLVDRRDERWFEAELHRLKGEALLADSPEHATEAEACYHEALAVACDQGARLWELRASTSFARLRADQDKRAEAHDLLAPTFGWFTEGFETADLREAKALLNELG
jgi:predicted ATPase